MEHIILTGASSGIGQAIACRLSNDNTTIVNLDRQPGDETREACAGQFHTVLTETGDASSIQEGFEAADALFGGAAPDLLVCCAALSKAAHFLEVPTEDLDLLLQVNIRGTFLCCQHAAARMAKARSGRIIVITSLCAHQAWAQETVYCITKGAQQSLVQSLAVELAPFGIMVNGIAPGLIEQTGDSMAKTRDDPDILEHQLQRTSLGRVGSVQEVAEAAEYLSRVTWTTGQSLVLDGGYLATGLGYFGDARKRLLKE